MTNNKEVELKPCPFCSGKLHIVGEKTIGWNIGCTNPDCLVWLPELNKNDFYTRKEDVIKAWNTRPPQRERKLDKDKLQSFINSVCNVDFASGKLTRTICQAYQRGELFNDMG